MNPWINQLWSVLIFLRKIVSLIFITVHYGMEKFYDVEE